MVNPLISKSPAPPGIQLHQPPAADASTAPPLRVLLVAAADAGLRLASVLEARGATVATAGSSAQAAEMLAEQPCDVLVLQQGLSPEGQDELVLRCRAADPGVPVVRLAALPEGADSPAGEAVAWINVQHSLEEFRQMVSSAGSQARVARENRVLKRRLLQRRTREIVGHSGTIEALRRAVNDAAGHDEPALILGEHGSGKELAARAIHDASDRAYRPFVRVNCSVLSSAALERELYGVTAGPGREGYPGRMELADGGVLVLDEVQDIALPLQAKLLKTLESRRYESLGSDQSRSLNVRIIAISSAPLTEMSEQGAFRTDLYEHLSHCVIKTPALRDHAEDIAQLTEHFLTQGAVREGKPARRLMLDALQTLQVYEWPGNVRELENLIERASSLDVGAKLTADMVRPWLGVTVPGQDQSPVGLSLAEMERKLIEATFNRLGGNRERTAQALQIGLRTLSSKLREYGYPPRGGPGSNQNQEARAA